MTESAKVWKQRYEDLRLTVHKLRAEHICGGMDRDRIYEILEENASLTADGFDEAIVGITEDYRAVYSTQKCLEILESHGMTAEEAREHFGYNVLRANECQDEAKRPVFVDFICGVPHGT